jgi:WD40 repeat protein
LLRRKANNGDSNSDKGGGLNMGEAILVRRGGGGGKNILSFNKLDNPVILPTGSSRACAWSPDNRFIAVGHDSTPFLTVYDLNTGVPVKLANPSTLPTGAVKGCAWFPDDATSYRYLAVAHTNSPYITIYKLTVSTTPTMVKLADPSSLPDGNGMDCRWNNQRFLAVAHNGSNQLSIYNWVSESNFNKIYNAVTSNYAGDCCDWSPPAGLYLALCYHHATSYGFYLRLFKRTSGPFASNISMSVIVPDSSLTTFANDCAWSPNGRYLAIAKNRVYVYDFISGSPVELDTSHIQNDTCYGCTWSPSGRYLVALGQSIRFFDFTSGAPVEVTALSIAGPNDGYVFYRGAWSPNGKYLAAVHYSSPYIHIFENKLEFA